VRKRWLIAALLCAVLLAGCADATGGGTASSSESSPAIAGVAATLTVEATPSAPATQIATAPKPKSPAKPAAAPARAKARNPRLYPDPRLTPGAVFNVTAAQVSVSGYSSGVRNVPRSEKADAFAEYRLSYPQPTGAYECDHFIPLCLGGSNDIRNLWPEPAPEFHWKDGLEVYLWRRVRAGSISLPEAQREVRTDWYAYWVKYGKPGRQESVTYAAPAAAAPSFPKAKGGETVGWSVSGQRYHLLTCSYFAGIKAANRRTGTIAQAKGAGKTPCRVCNPPE
jgi:hypothetical protein